MKAEPDSGEQGRLAMAAGITSAAGARQAVEQREVEFRWCGRCDLVTEHYPVLWYVHRHRYDPPIETVRGGERVVITNIAAKVFVMWCYSHRGDAPLRYTDQPIPPGGLS